jgi:hypothetical protein
VMCIDGFDTLLYMQHLTYKRIWAVECVIHLLYTYLYRKLMLYVNPQCIEIFMLIEEKRKIIHHYHYNLLIKIALYMTQYIF